MSLTNGYSGRDETIMHGFNSCHTLARMILTCDLKMHCVDSHRNYRTLVRPQVLHSKMRLVNTADADYFAKSGCQQLVGNSMQLDDCGSNLTPSESANEKIRSRHGLSNEKIVGLSRTGGRVRKIIGVMRQEVTS